MHSHIYWWVAYCSTRGPLCTTQWKLMYCHAAMPQLSTGMLFYGVPQLHWTDCMVECEQKHVVTIFVTVFLILVWSSPTGCHENPTELEVYQLMDTIQMMQMGVAQSPSTIWMTENWFMVVAGSCCHAFTHLLVGCLLQYSGTIMYHIVEIEVLSCCYATTFHRNAILGCPSTTLD